MKTRNTFTKLSAAALALTMFAVIWAVWGAQPGKAIAVAGSRASSLPGLQGKRAVQQLKQLGLYDSLEEETVCVCAQRPVGMRS